MLGVAAGLAGRGFIPFCYSIATFASMRGYEQLRNGAVHHELPVRVVGIGGGFSYGSAGFTHHALEDLGLMRLQPGMAVVAPADDRQAGAAVRATMDLPGPVYLRLSKDSGELPGFDGRFRWGRLELLGDEAADVAILATGNMAAVALEARAILEQRGVSAVVAVAACLAPPPTDDIVALIGGRAAVVTAEDHYATGGLASLTAETIATAGLGTRIERCAVEAGSDGKTGSEKFLRRKYGLDADAIVQAALRAAKVGAATS